MTEKRFNELYTRAYERCHIEYSDFLNMEEQSVLASLFLPCVSWGGYDSAERVVAPFGEGIQKEKFPISCLCAAPVSAKFADSLTHRDFLGALMNLGIKREMLGDIVIDDNCGYIFCLDKIGDYIIDNLKKVKHTSVSVKPADSLPEKLGTPPPEKVYILASLRLDVAVSAVYNLSRKQTSQLLAGERIFVNSRQVSNASYILKDGDTVSVRGSGRFVFSGVEHRTKKDRLAVMIRKY